MRRHLAIIALLFAALSVSCAKRGPERPGVPAGTPHVTWILMSGDSGNPDQDFVCQSDPRNECVLTVSSPDRQVFSDMHFYFHGGGAETKYEGTIDIGYLQVSGAAHRSPTSITVRKGESITNQSVTGIVTSAPGSYTVTVSLTATIPDTRTTQPIRESVHVTVK